MEVVTCVCGSEGVVITSVERFVYGLRGKLWTYELEKEKKSYCDEEEFVVVSLYPHGTSLVENGF